MNNLAEMQAVGQDFEFYPTTNAIIAAFFNHAKALDLDSLADIGAGNGKVLLAFKALTETKERHNDINLFAMEKSRILLDSMPMEISILGTDFWEQSMIDKHLDCIFSNPPYSEFINWCDKLIREANANYIYLVIPQRWKTQKAILDAIAARQAKYTIIGEFDFLDAEDRKAQAKVDLVFIELSESMAHRRRHSHHEYATVDPFELWVNDYFGLAKNANKETVSEYDIKQREAEERAKKLANALVPGEDLITRLYGLYLSEMDTLLNNYKKVCGLDVALFKELGVSVKSIVASLKTRISGLKDAYWHELFDNYAPLTSRLTAASCSNFISTIRAKTSIDFTPSNAYALTVWAIKNANQYFDKQMIDTFEKMVSSANTKNYKSNARVFENDLYRYNAIKPSHYTLEYRIVCARVGGIFKGSYRYASNNGLEPDASKFLGDLMVIAQNLGFSISDKLDNHHFQSNRLETIYCLNKANERVVLMEVRAFLNGNLHIKFNQQFMLALNVEVGRLLGWVHDAKEAADEMGVNVREVSGYFKTNYTALPNTIDQLLLAA